MAKKKAVTSESNMPKRKKLSSDENVVHTDTTVDNRVKKKKKKMEEAPVQISEITENDPKPQKSKKNKKKRVKEEQQTQDTEISVLPGGPADTQGEEEEDLTPEERRVLERKMKKILKKEEKKRLKAEGETAERTEAVGPTASQQALDYLQCWSEQRAQWKFQKTRQTWLLQHMLDPEKIPEEKFSVLLSYLEGLRGAARDTSVQKALAVVEESGKAPDDVLLQQRAHRAKEVIQLLS